MAQYEHLPIFRKSVELGVYLDKVVRNFSRYHKYSVGSDLRELSRKILFLVILANSERDKVKSLRKLVETCEMLKTMLFFAKEIQAFQNFQNFQCATALAVILCKQSQGWLNSSLKKGRNYQPASKPGR